MNGILNFFGLSYAKLAIVAVTLLAIVGLGITVKIQHGNNLLLKTQNAQQSLLIQQRDDAIATMKTNTEDLQAGYQAFIKKQQDDQTVKDYLNSKLTDTQDLINDFESKPTPAKVKPLEKSLSGTYNAISDCISFESGKKYETNPCTAISK